MNPLASAVGQRVTGARHAALGRKEVGAYTAERFLERTQRPLVTGVREGECTPLRLRWIREQVRR